MGESEARCRVLWTAESIATLKEMYAAGMSAGLIGRKMSLSRNSVIGKIHRLGLSREGEPTQRLPASSPPRKRPRRWGREPVINIVARIVNKRAGVVHPKSRAVARMSAQPSSDCAVRFLDRNVWQCAWPLWGEGVPLEAKMVCGAVVVAEDCSWCARHKRMATDRAAA